MKRGEKMKSALVRLGLATALAASFAGCGGSGGGESAAPATGTADGAVASIAAQNPAASNTANNPVAAFSLIVDAGLTPVTVSSPPVVNFAVIDSSGKHVSGLKLIGGDSACGGNNVKLAIAKFDGSNWQSLISRQRYAADSAGQYAVVEGATDPVPTATIANPATALADPATRVVGILQENAAAGYYTYNFATDVTKPLKITDAVEGRNVSPGKLANNEKLAAKDNATVHRVGIQLCFVDPQTKATVKVNPYLDFTLDSAGTAHPLKDSQGKLVPARQVVDKASCNECHQTLAARHDDGLVDPNFCVVCHNAGSTDYITRNPIDLKLMAHRIHMGKKLKQDFQVGSFVARKDTAGVITGVDYPQEQRNCVKCHDGSANAAHQTKDGDNWKAKPSKNACWGCHNDYKVAGSNWQLAHIGAPTVYPGQISLTDPDSSQDSVCVNCHNPNAPVLKIDAVHAIPEWTNGANYQYNIHAVTWNADRTVSVEFSVSNPVNGIVYNVKDPSYQYTTVDSAGTTTTKNFVFGRLAMLFGWGSGDYNNTGAVAATTWGSSCTTAVPTGSPTCNATTGLPAATAGGALVTRGQPVLVSVFDAVPVAGTGNHFRVTSTPLPASASGTGVVALQGRVSLKKDNNSSYAVPVKNVVSYFAIGGSGDAVPRRTVVSADKCNVCHGRNINAHGHGGSRTDPEVCVICHNGNNVLNGTTVVGGKVTVLPDSAHFKRFIHMRHKAQGANFPVMPRTNGSTKGSYKGYTGVRVCTVCHVNDSYKSDRGVMGSSTVLEVDLSKDSSNATITDTDPSNNPVISPKAAACSSCHDTDVEKNHMENIGGAVFGTVTQGDIAAGKVYEACDGCHAPGSLAPVDVKHGLQ